MKQNETLTVKLVEKIGLFSAVALSKAIGVTVDELYDMATKPDDHTIGKNETILQS